MRITTLFTAFFALIILTGCVKDNKELMIAQALLEMDEALCIPIDTDVLTPDVMLSDDIPVYNEGTLTYVNKVNFQNATNIFHRYNTDKGDFDKTIEYFKEELPKEGWEINDARSSKNKFFVSKDDRFVTVRVFEMPVVPDSMATAIAISLVKPK